MPSQTNWTSILEDLAAGFNLTRGQSSWALSEIIAELAPEAEVSNFLIDFEARVKPLKS